MEAILLYLFLACTLALACALQFCSYTFTPRTGRFRQVHFTSRWNTCFARGRVIQMRSNVPFSSIHP